LKILIDADGCPVVDLAIKIAKTHSIKCIILCDTSHYFNRDGAETITVSKGADSVDFKLVNIAIAGDIVITQDYGLAAMCLAKNAIVLSQDGMVYNSSNIDTLLMSRHIAKKARMSGVRVKGAKKRTTEQDMAFKASLEAILT